MRLRELSPRSLRCGRAFEEEVKRRATSRIKDFEDEAKAARAEHEEERSRLKLLEMDMAKELEARQTSFEAEVRKKANEAVDVFKKLAKEAQEKAESERSARTTRELELTARFDEMKAQIEADAMRRGNELVEEYKNDEQGEDWTGMWLDTVPEEEFDDAGSSKEFFQKWFDVTESMVAEKTVTVAEMKAAWGLNAPPEVPKKPSYAEPAALAQIGRAHV